MNSISFHIHKTPNHKTWTLSYTINGQKHTSEFTTKNKAMQASYNMAKVATD